MRTTMKRCAALLLAVLMLLSLVACGKQDYDEADFEPNLSNLPNIEGVNFAAEIKGYTQDSFNFFYLDEGDTHSPQGALFVDKSNGIAYSSDPTVVRVDNHGVVTAVGTGTAYVLICYGLNREQTKITKYMVNHPDNGKDFFANPDSYAKRQSAVMIIIPLVVLLTVGGVIAALILSTRSKKVPTDPMTDAFTGVPFNDLSTPLQPNNTPVTQPTSKTVCPYCGTKLESVSCFCPDCGQRIK